MDTDQSQRTEKSGKIDRNDFYTELFNLPINSVLYPLS